MMTKPTEDERLRAREFVRSHRFSATRGDVVMETTIEAHAHGLAANRAAIEAFQQELKRWAKDFHSERQRANDWMRKCDEARTKCERLLAVMLDCSGPCYPIGCSDD